MLGACENKRKGKDVTAEWKCSELINMSREVEVEV